MPWQVAWLQWLVLAAAALHSIVPLQGGGEALQRQGYNQWRAGTRL